MSLSRCKHMFIAINDLHLSGRIFNMYQLSVSVFTIVWRRSSTVTSSTDNRTDVNLVFKALTIENKRFTARLETRKSKFRKKSKTKNRSKLHVPRKDQVKH